MPNTFKSSATQNLGTTPTAVYTAPTSSGNTATVIGCSFANTTNAPITVSLQLSRQGLTSGGVYLVKQATVPVGGALVAVGAEQKIILIAGDALTGTSSVASSSDVLVSVLEIT